VAGGRVGLALEPTLLATLARGRKVALVSGTNGKTTTTALLVAARSDPVGTVPVATNRTGANMPAGQVAALAEAAEGADAVLEVDEGYLGRLIEETRPRVVLLLNLSRDQLDRISEVRMLAERWRTALGHLDPDPEGAGTVVVANADDPMVVWAAGGAPEVRWVGAGQVWHHDAVGCPSCGGGIRFAADGAWACDSCPFSRPDRDAWLEGSELVTAGGARFPFELALPGRFNRANAALVAVAAPLLDRPAATTGPTDRPMTEALALARMATVTEVAGRFATVRRRGRTLRLLLAKNPAGWTAMLDLLEESGPRADPVVLSINARVADGLDPSWLWDVPFERLAGRTVVATGDRRLDLAVRLHYAGVETTVVPDPLAAVDRAIDLGAPPAPGTPPADTLDLLGNYTAFGDLRARL
jgi:UDP-N-acetylmuramyl tripeptide synthase